MEKKHQFQNLIPTLTISLPEHTDFPQVRDVNGMCKCQGASSFNVQNLLKVGNCLL